MLGLGVLRLVGGASVVPLAVRGQAGVFFLRPRLFLLETAHSRAVLLDLMLCIPLFIATVLTSIRTRHPARPSLASLTASSLRDRATGTSEEVRSVGAGEFRAECGGGNPLSLAIACLSNGCPGGADDEEAVVKARPGQARAKGRLAFHAGREGLELLQDLRARCGSRGRR